MMISRMELDAAVASNSYKRLTQCGVRVKSILQKSEIGVYSNKVIKKATMVQMETIDPTMYTANLKGLTLKMR